MKIKQAASAGGGFLKDHLSEIFGSLLVFGAGIGSQQYLNLTGVYPVAISAIAALLVIAYLENVKYYWVDQ